MGWRGVGDPSPFHFFLVQGLNEWVGFVGIDDGDGDEENDINKETCACVSCTL